MQFYRTVKANKKGSGLTDFFSVLIFALILIVFYLLLKLTIGNVTYELSVEHTNIKDSISLISILKTAVEVNNMKMDIAELIALAEVEPSKNELLDKTLKEIIDKSFGTNNCAIMCINGRDERKIEGEGCDFTKYNTCPEEGIKIPSHDSKLIRVSFTSDTELLILQPYT